MFKIFLKNSVVFINLILMLTSINALNIFVPENDVKDSDPCGLVVFNKRHKTHALVLDFLEDNWTLNACLSTLSVDNDRIIFSGDYEPDNITKQTMDYFRYNIPNIVMYTSSFSNSFFTNTIATIYFKSHWSLVNIVVVNNSTFTCVNGYFSKEANSSIYDFLNRLWHHYQTVYVVVEYPNDCPNKFSTFDGNKDPSHQAGQLYNRTVITVHGNDLHETLQKSDRYLTHGYPLKTNIFKRFPTAITDCNNSKLIVPYNSNLTNEYCGVDAFIMHDILQFFKFNATFEMQDTTSYGYLQAGRITGSLGLVVRGEIDISFNARFMVLYLSKNEFHFLYYMGTDSLCAVLKEPSDIPLWHYPYDIYDKTTWVFTLSCLMLLGSFMYAKKKLFKKIGSKPLPLHVYVINAVWSGFFGFFFNRKIKRSLTASICLLCSVVLTAKYQGHVNYMFATLVRYSRYKTLNEMCENNVAVYTSPSIAILLGHEYSEGYLDPNFPSNAKTTLIRRLKYYPEKSSATVYSLSNPGVATIERIDVLLLTFINMTERTGRPSLYAVSECFHQYYLSYIVRTGFLFTSDLQVLMMQIVEAGLPTVYNRWQRYMFKVADPVGTPKSEPRPSLKISIHEQKVPLLLLLSGYVLSTAVFLMEMWWDTRTKRAMNMYGIQEYID